jgi:hypothetical protein
MATRTLLSCLVVCFALGGCAAGITGADRFLSPKKLECKNENQPCPVIVKVVCKDSSCWLTVDNDVVVIYDKKKIKIEWTLEGPSGYKFADPGIVIDESPPPDFNCTREGNLKYACMNKHTRFGVYKYTVNVTGPQDLKLDPWIVND